MPNFGGGSGYDMAKSAGSPRTNDAFPRNGTGVSADPRRPDRGRCTVSAAARTERSGEPVQPVSATARTAAATAIEPVPAAGIGATTAVEPVSQSGSVQCVSRNGRLVLAWRSEAGAASAWGATAARVPAIPSDPRAGREGRRRYQDRQRAQGNT